MPKQVKAIAQIGIFIHGVSASAPNKDNAITFMKWFAHRRRRRLALARAGDLPVRTKPLQGSAAVKAHRLLPTVARAARRRRRRRGRARPTGRQVETILGIELNKALLAGKGGGARARPRRQAVHGLSQAPGYYS